MALLSSRASCLFLLSALGLRMSSYGSFGGTAVSPRVGWQHSRCRPPDLHHDRALLVLSVPGREDPYPKCIQWFHGPFGVRETWHLFIGQHPTLYGNGEGSGELELQEGDPSFQIHAIGLSCPGPTVLFWFSGETILADFPSPSPCLIYILPGVTPEHLQIHESSLDEWNCPAKATLDQWTSSLPSGMWTPTVSNGC